MSRRKLTRRQFVAATALSSAAFVAAPFVRTARAAGSLSVGFWDHWVPDANKACTALINEWSEKEKVEVSIDYITTQGNKLFLTIAAEGQAKSGHDILAMPTWWPHSNAELLEPVNDIMEPLIKQNGEVNGTVQYLGKAGDKWLGVPACIGSQIKGPCSRIDLMKKYAGIDVQEMYPAGSPPKADNWTTDTFLKAAEACKKGGFPFGIGVGETPELGRYRRRIFPGVRGSARRRQGQPRGQDRRGAAGPRILQEAYPPTASRRRVLGRCQQQQGAGFRRERIDHESAQRLGRRQARCAASCRAMLDAWLPGGTERPVCAVRSLLLDHYGTSPRTRKPRRACLSIFLNRLRSRSL